MIRKITKHDLEIIHHLNVNELGGSSDIKTTQSTLTRLLDLPDQHYLIGYEVDGKLVGYLHAQMFEMLYNPNALLNVISMAVTSDTQGKGIGMELMEAIEDIGRDLGLDGIRINSGHNRERTHQFYEKHGYVSNRDQKRFIKLFN